MWRRWISLALARAQEPRKLLLQRLQRLQRQSLQQPQGAAEQHDETQPVDDGMGRAIKIFMGKEEEEWLEDDENLSKWENNELTASDRRILNS